MSSSPQIPFYVGDPCFTEVENLNFFSFYFFTKVLIDHKADSYFVFITYIPTFPCTLPPAILGAHYCVP